MAVYRVYTDESRQTGNHEFRAVGGVWVLKYDAPRFENEFHRRCRALGGTPQSIAFKKAPAPTSAFMPYYQAFVDCFFDFAAHGRMAFRAVVVDKRYNFAHADYHDGDYETGFSKLYYQLLSHWMRSLDTYHVCIASRTFGKKAKAMSAEQRLGQLKSAINLSFPRTSPVVSMELRDASEVRMVQLADLLTSSVSFHWNRAERRPIVKAGKAHIAQYICRKAGVPSLRHSTHAAAVPINIFRMHAKPG